MFSLLLDWTSWTNTWWRHQEETYSALLAFCEGNPPVTLQIPVARSFDVFFDVLINKRLGRQSIRRWCERPWRSMSRHCIESMWCWFEMLRIPWMWRHVKVNLLKKKSSLFICLVIITIALSLPSSSFLIVLCEWGFPYVNSLSLNDAIWWHRSWLTLAQVMSYCLTAPSHYLNQYWLINGVLWHSPRTILIPQEVLMNVTRNMYSEITLFKLLPHFPMC